ncbi:MAG: CpXC domain-containing protein, partial [Candidatus Scatosoma sp.]
MQKIFKTKICPHCGAKIVFTAYKVVNEKANPGFVPAIGEYVTNVMKCPHCK